jgi:hypothetical protein
MHQEVVDLGEILKPNRDNDNRTTADSPVVVTPTTAATATARLILDCHNQLGEGIVFDDRTNTVLWTDILSSKFHSLILNDTDPSQSLHTIHDLPKKLASFGLLRKQQSDNTSEEYHDESSLPLLCAWEDGFQLYDVYQARALSELSNGEDVNPQKVRFVFSIYFPHVLNRLLYVVLFSSHPFLKIYSPRIPNYGWFYTYQMSIVPFVFVSV